MNQPQSDQRQATGLRAKVLGVCGFGCLLAWTYVVFFSRLIHFSTRSGISHLNSTYSFACIGMAVGLIVCALPWNALLGRVARRMSPITLGKRGRIVALAVTTALLAVCTITLVMVERRWFTQPWCSIISTISGVSVAVHYLFWSTRVTSLRFDSIAWFVCGAFVFGAAVFVGILYLPLLPAVALTTALPALSALGITGARGIGTGEMGGHALPQASRRVFFRVLACFTLIGFAESFVRALFLLVDPATDSVAYRWLLFMGTLVASGIILAANFYRSNTARGMNRASLLTLVVLSLLAPLVSGMGLLSDLPVFVCYYLFYIVVWTYLALTSQAYTISPVVTFGLGLGLAYAGCLAGNFLGSVVASFVTLDWRLDCLLALACSTLILVALLFVADERAFAALISPDTDEQPQTKRRFMQRVDDVALAHGLTAKETEVFMLAAKGRTSQRIGEMLGLSTGTVNTHFMHIYKKLDVHDRQELIDLVDDYETGAEPTSAH